MENPLETHLWVGRKLANAFSYPYVKHLQNGGILKAKQNHR